MHLRKYIKRIKIRPGTKHTSAEADIMGYSSSGLVPPSKNEKDGIAVPAALCKMRHTEVSKAITILTFAPRHIGKVSESTPP